MSLCAETAAEKGTAVAQYYSPCWMTYIQGTPMGVQTYWACVFVCVYVECTVRVVCHCASHQMLSCVLAAVCFP